MARGIDVEIMLVELDTSETSSVQLDSGQDKKRQDESSLLMFGEMKDIYVNVVN